MPADGLIVLDASALVAWITRVAEPRLGERIAGAAGVHAPALLDLEAASALRGLERAGAMTPEHATAAVRWLSTARIVRHRHDRFSRRIWDLRHALSIYDASYAAVAEALRAPLVTCDARLASAGAIQAEVEVFG
jgi:predicted nucleic acid-binding protein